MDYRVAQIPEAAQHPGCLLLPINNYLSTDFPERCFGMTSELPTIRELMTTGLWFRP